MRKSRIKFSLEMRDGEQARDIDTLREYFDTEKIVGYFQDGKLLTWLEDRFYDDEAEAVRGLSNNEPNLGKRLAEILGVAASVEDVDPETVAWRNERLARLKQYTNDPDILASVDNVAFDQEDFEDIMHEEELPPTVYLCGNTFNFPSGILKKKNIRYMGIGKSVTAEVKSKEPIDFAALGVVFENVEFDEKYAKIIEKTVPIEVCNEPISNTQKTSNENPLDYRQADSISIVTHSKKSVIDLHKSRYIVGVGWDISDYEGYYDFDLDVSAFIVDKNGKVIRDDDFIFYNNLKHYSCGVEHLGDVTRYVGHDEEIKIDLARIPAEYKKITFTLAIHEPENRRQNFGMLSNVCVGIVDLDNDLEIEHYDLRQDYSIETAIILCEIYRENTGWKFARSGAGFVGGLIGMCRMFGVNV